MRISDWSSDVCSSDLLDHRQPEFGWGRRLKPAPPKGGPQPCEQRPEQDDIDRVHRLEHGRRNPCPVDVAIGEQVERRPGLLEQRPEQDRSENEEDRREYAVAFRSDEHTSELKSLMRLSYAVF